MKRGVHGVLLSGDIVDKDSKYYEALGPLEAGLQRLDSVGIPVIAVAGNHDHDILPSIADLIEADNFYVLGKGGVWERYTLDAPPNVSEEAYLIDGWSFPNRHYIRSPLEDYAIEPSPHPTIGLLHADTGGGADSQYAPITDKEIDKAIPELWVLGHLHRPRVWSPSAQTTALYPGSVQPLNPTETQTHGPHLLKHTPKQGWEIEQVPLQSVRYDHRKIKLRDVRTTQEVQDELHRAVQKHINNLETKTKVKELILRVELTGATYLQEQIYDTARHLEENLDIEKHGVAASIDRIKVHTHPAIELSEIATETSPRGILAQFLLHIESGELNPEEKEMLEQLRVKLQEGIESTTYEPAFQQDTFSAETALAPKELFRSQALRLLKKLTAQKQQEEIS